MSSFFHGLLSLSCRDACLSALQLVFVSLDLMLMRLSLIVAIFAVVTSTGAADIKPTDSSNFLFRILKFQTLRGGDHPQGVADDEHPLLVVWSLREVRLAGDDKGVLIVLTPKDAKTFTAITSRLRSALLTGCQVTPGDCTP
jgi:hypothetical protein